ncbi:hypothetical protein QYE76_013546 [Lolium multiflorum]|uniref:DUF7595 domain-containing protein n=1 Tax=Lolium multiflorum TaxID=4521 RepID=A0AAD8U335_LOLMU|nr:hypothetical protein QYE76_013546 [Lolium multiflorum]
MDAPPAATDWTLPSDLILEIAGRSDISTVVAFTLACKLLRRDILSPSFIAHLTQRGGIVPPCILAYLHSHDDVEDPPAASAFLNRHIYPSVSRFADDLLAEHVPLTSRGGLVLFRRRRISDKLYKLCVYDIFSGHRTLFSDPLNAAPKYRPWLTRYVLLTAADGIDCSFLLFVLDRVTVPGDIYTSTIEIHTASSMSSTWTTAITSRSNSIFFSQLCQGMHGNIVVLQGGVIHWLVRKRGEIVSYNVCTTEQGTIKLPCPVIGFDRPLHLGSYYSHDGKKLLRLFTYNKFEISVWNQLPNGDWASEAAKIDIQEKLQSLDPHGQPYQNMVVQFECSSEKNNIVLLHIKTYSGNLRRPTMLIILDLETKEMCEEQHRPTSSSMLLEIDISSRLRAMKVSP